MASACLKQTVCFGHLQSLAATPKHAHEHEHEVVLPVLGAVVLPLLGAAVVIRRDRDTAGRSIVELTCDWFIKCAIMSQLSRPGHAVLVLRKRHIEA